MIELLSGLPPLAVVVIVVLGAALAFAAAVEIGIVGFATGGVVLAYALAHDWDPVLAGVATIVATVVGGIVHALIRPQLPCLLCKGEPRNYGIGGAWSDCLLCGGSGKRRRLGSKVLSRHRKH